MALPFQTPVPLVTMPTEFALARPAALWLLLLIPLVVLVARYGRVAALTRRPQTLLRVLAITLIVAALAEPLIGTSSAQTSTVFVVDRSLSIDERTTQSVNDWILKALQSAEGADSINVINFATAPELAPSSTSADLGDIPLETGSDFGVDSTNIESAITMARAMPGGSGKRIILISDGAENEGSLLNQASQAATEDLAINVLPLEGVASDSLQITGVDAASAVWTNELLKVTASVASEVEAKGKLEFLIDGTMIQSNETTFPQGLSSYPYDATDLTPGFHSITVRVIPEGVDSLEENNTNSIAVMVRDEPEVMVVSAVGNDASLITAALERSGVGVTVTTPEDLPTRTSDLTNYDVFILVNLPAADLSIDQMSAFKELTTTHGKGLIVIGGTFAYGAGGYAGTVLEEALPVRVKVTEGKERQKVALLIILDKSGSMVTDQQSGISKIELAREAVRLAGGVLIEGDEFGLIAFSDQPDWTVPLKVIEGPEDRDLINAAIDKVVADGSTNMYSALETGLAAIYTSTASVKHVVLLSDGKSSTGTRESYQKLIDDARANGVSLSTIAIGEDSDLDLLQFLANKGNGRHSFAETPDQIPQLTMAEAQSAGSQSILRGGFQVLQESPSPIMSTIDLASMPPLDGYDFAEAKLNAQVILKSDREDPVLAKWQLGLGRVVAFLSDDGIDLASQWPDWAQYDEFWTSTLRWTLPDPENSTIQLQVEQSVGGLQLVVTNNAGNSELQSLTGQTITVTDASGSIVSEQNLTLSGPREYRVQLPAAPSGAYAVAISDTELAGSLSFSGAFTIPRSDELKPAPGADALLLDVANLTDGRILCLDDPAAAFDAPASDAAAIPDYRGVWWIPLSFAIAALLIELGIRYRFLDRFGVSGQ